MNRCARSAGVLACKFAQRPAGVPSFHLATGRRLNSQPRQPRYGPGCLRGSVALMITLTAF
jgi:hypothetical protein